jgi:hypothetical protein
VCAGDPRGRHGSAAQNHAAPPLAKRKMGDTMTFSSPAPIGSRVAAKLGSWRDQILVRAASADRPSRISDGSSPGMVSALQPDRLGSLIVGAGRPSGPTEAGRSQSSFRRHARKNSIP